MERILAQAVKIPAEGGSVDINYPTNFSFNFTSLGSVISASISFILAFASIGLLLMILNSGFSLMTGAGDAKKMEEARARLTYAIVGFIVIFSAYWIVQLTGEIFGLPFMQIFPGK